MKKVEFIASATFMFCDKKDQRVSVWVDGEPFGELHHDDGEEWYLLTYEKGFGDSFIADSVVYYDDLEETEAEIKAEIENY
jgi:hypothetical protein